MSCFEKIERREFLRTTFYGSLGFSGPLTALLAGDQPPEKRANNAEYLALVTNLLKQWCDGMLAVQIIQPDNPKLHGALVMWNAS